jgi:hypothetical protein
MTDSSIFVPFFGMNPPEDPALVTRALTAFERTGFTSDRDTESPLDPDTVTLGDGTRRLVSYDDYSVSFSFSTGREDGCLPSFFTLRADTTDLRPPREPTTDGDDFFDVFVELLTRLGVALDPVYAPALDPSHARTAGKPNPREFYPRQSPLGIDRVPWLGLYGTRLIESLGGREHVFATPAWHVEELDNGVVLIVTSREPWESSAGDRDATTHLLEHGVG